MREITQLAALFLCLLARKLPRNPTFGVFQVGCTAGFMTVLSWADYSYVMPVGAFGYAMVTLLAVIFLHERVSEIIILVNSLEKSLDREFSICVFGSVSVLGSQTISIRNSSPLWLTPSVFVRLP